MIKYLSLNNSYSSKHHISFSETRIILLWTLIFALVFVNLPWQIIKGAEFTDIGNYIRRFNSDLDLSFSFNKIGFLKVFTSEYLWAVIIVHLKGLGLPLIQVFKCISFFSIFSLGYFTLKKSKNYLLSSLLLLNPLLVDFVMSQIRNSFALAILVLALLCENKWLKISLLIASCMIHSSAIVILFLIFVLNRFTYEEKYKNLAALVFVGISVAFTLSIGKTYILELLGDRRAAIVQPQSSILYSIFWVLYLCLIVYLKKLLVQDIYTKMSFTLILVFFASVVFGIYASRYLAIVLPFLIIAILSFQKTNRNILSGILFFYQLILFVYWVN